MLNWIQDHLLTIAKGVKHSIYIILLLFILITLNEVVIQMDINNQLLWFNLIGDAPAHEYQVEIMSEDYGNISRAHSMQQF